MFNFRLGYGRIALVSGFILIGSLGQMAGATAVGSAGSETTETLRTAHWQDLSGHYRDIELALRRSIQSPANVRRGEWDKVAERFRGLANAAEASGDSRIQAMSLGGLGLTLTYLRRFEEAEKMLERSGNLARESGQDDVFVRTLINLALTKTIQKPPPPSLVRRSTSSRRNKGRGRSLGGGGFAGQSAPGLYANAARLALEGGNYELAFQSNLYAGRYFLRQDNIADALGRFMQAGSMVADLPDYGSTRWKLELADQLTLINGTRSQNTEAARLIYSTLISVLSTQSQTSPQQETVSLRERSRATGLMARLYYQQKRYSDAADLAERAISLAEISTEGADTYEWLALLGLIEQRRGNMTGATRLLEEAVTDLQSVNVNTGFDLLLSESHFKDRITPIYLALADIYLSDKHGTKARLKEAQRVIEDFRTAEISEYYRLDCTIEAVGAILETAGSQDGTAIVYPILFDDRVEYLISANGATTRVTVNNISSFELGRMVETFLAAVKNRGSDKYLVMARELDDLLIRPIEPTLKRAGAKTLIFVPDGALRALPLAALHNGSSFLVERYSLSLVPGLKLTTRTPIEKRENEFLLVGVVNADADNLTPRGKPFSPLIHVSEELQTLEARAGKNVLRIENFTKEQFRTALKETAYSVVVLASHAEFSDNVDESFVLARDEKLTLPELEALIRATKVSGQPIDLLVLSACDTAVGGDFRAAMGLAGMAVRSGARSVLATLWKVSDESTAKAVPWFFDEHFGNELSKADALRQTQLRMMQSEYDHPYYWAPFVMIGNWE